LVQSHEDYDRRLRIGAWGLGIGLGGWGRGGGRDIDGGLRRWRRRAGFGNGGFGRLRLRLGRDQDERGRDLERRALGFEQSQLVEVAMESAVVGIHAALEAAQLAAGVGVSLADGGLIGEVGAGGDLGNHDFDF